jgi:DegV family protein with EDD domain
MSSIAVITDTDASLPTDLAAKYAIRQVPITIHFGQDTLLTDADIVDAGLFARVDREGKMPSTSAPSPGQFSKAFDDAFASGAEAAICICVSSEISATYQAALAARAMAPERDITVIDSRHVSMAQGFMALVAAEAAQAGVAKEEILARVHSTGERASLFGALATLKYLAMSGRVGHVAAGFGNLLNVKPIVTMHAGKLEMLERVRSRQKAWTRLIELAGAALEGRSIERLAVLHVAAPEDAQAFEARLCDTLACPPEIVRAEFTPGLSVHTGRGLIGLVVVAAA